MTLCLADQGRERDQAQGGRRALSSVAIARTAAVMASDVPRRSTMSDCSGVNSLLWIARPVGAANTAAGR